MSFHIVEVSPVDLHCLESSVLATWVVWCNTRLLQMFDGSDPNKKAILSLISYNKYNLKHWPILCGFMVFRSIFQFLRFNPRNIGGVQKHWSIYLSNKSHVHQLFSLLCAVCSLSGCRSSCCFHITLFTSCFSFRELVTLIWQGPAPHAQHKKTTHVHFQLFSHSLYFRCPGTFTNDFYFFPILSTVRKCNSMQARTQRPPDSQVSVRYSSLDLVWIVTCWKCAADLVKSSDQSGEDSNLILLSHSEKQL